MLNGINREILSNTVHAMKKRRLRSLFLGFKSTDLTDRFLNILVSS